jgi:hypothetical protein
MRSSEKRGLSTPRLRSGQAGRIAIPRLRSLTLAPLGMTPCFFAVSPSPVPYAAAERPRWIIAVISDAGTGRE